MSRSLLRSFPQSLDQAHQRLEHSTTDEEVMKMCRWICKRIVRAGFYVVMPRAKKFTKDLYPSYKTFSEFYPDKDVAMKTALKYCVQPISNKIQLIEFISDFGNWLEREIHAMK